MTRTVFRHKKLNQDTKKWESEIYFMHGAASNFENIDFDTDWRFCEVKGKREKSVLLGEIDLKDSDFPIKYPLVLKNGTKVFENNKETEVLMKRIFG
jgi:hypothetical protein